jgi:hypothetical protein
MLCADAEKIPVSGLDKRGGDVETCICFGLKKVQNYRNCYCMQIVFEDIGVST